LARLTARQRGVIRRRLYKDDEKRKRVTIVLSAFPIVFVLSYMSFIFLETFWIAVGVVGTWLAAIIVTNLAVFSDRGLAVDLLYQEIGERWGAFNERIGGNPKGPQFKKIATGYATVHSRLKEIDEHPPELKPLVDEVYAGALTLAGEWLRQDKVYQFYERARDINSKPLLEKARGLISTLVERTNDFAGLTDRLAEALNRLEAFELESEVAHEFGAKGPGATADFTPLKALVGDLRDWSACLTEAQEELDEEQL
jgi:hypothetical protein